MLRRTYKTNFGGKGPKFFSIATFSLWRLVKESMTAENCRVKGQLKEAVRLMEDVQYREFLTSCKGDPEGREPEKARISDSSDSVSRLRTGSFYKEFLLQSNCPSGW